MLFTWSILYVFNVENASLIFRTSEVLAEGLEACMYDLPLWSLEGCLLFSPEGFLVWKYLEMTLISFLVLAGSGGRGGALLIVTELGLGISFLVLLFDEGILGVNFTEILDLRVLVFRLVCKPSYLAS